MPHDGGGAIIPDQTRFVVLDQRVQVLLGLHVNLFFLDLVFEAQLVVVLERGALERAVCAHAGLRLVFRQLPRRHVLRVIQAAHNNGIIRITVQKFHHDFVTNAWQEHHAIPIAGKRLGHAYPTRIIQRRVIVAIPLHHHLHATVFVGVNLFAWGTHYHTSMRTPHVRPGRNTFGTVRYARWNGFKTVFVRRISFVAGIVRTVAAFVPDHRDEYRRVQIRIGMIDGVDSRANFETHIPRLAAVLDRARLGELLPNARVHLGVRLQLRHIGRRVATTVVNTRTMLGHLLLEPIRLYITGWSEFARRWCCLAHVLRGQKFTGRSHTCFGNEGHRIHAQFGEPMLGHIRTGVLQLRHAPRRLRRRYGIGQDQSVCSGLVIKTKPDAFLLQQARNAVPATLAIPKTIRPRFERAQHFPIVRGAFQQLVTDIACTLVLKNSEACIEAERPVLRHNFELVRRVSVWGFAAAAEPADDAVNGAISAVRQAHAQVHRHEQQFASFDVGAFADTTHRVPVETRQLLLTLELVEKQRIRFQHRVNAKRPIFL